LKREMERLSRRPYAKRGRKDRGKKKEGGGEEKGNRAGRKGKRKAQWGKKARRGEVSPPKEEFWGGGRTLLPRKTYETYVHQDQAPKETLGLNGKRGEGRGRHWNRTTPGGEKKSMRRVQRLSEGGEA